MPTLEEIVFQAGGDALADQDGVVTGIRQRTATLLAAHALVASFLGATTVKAKGMHGFSWAALVALVLGLVISAVLLSNWKLCPIGSRSTLIGRQTLFDFCQRGRARRSRESENR